MRIPPASVLCRTATVEDVYRWPDYFINGPGYDVARETQCPHGFYLTSSCPGCDVDREALGHRDDDTLDRTSPDTPTAVVAVYRKPHGIGFEVWVNGAFVCSAMRYESVVMEQVRRLGGQVVVVYEDDDSLTKRIERRESTKKV